MSAAVHSTEIETSSKVKRIWLYICVKLSACSWIARESADRRQGSGKYDEVPRLVFLF